ANKLAPSPRRRCGVPWAAQTVMEDILSFAAFPFVTSPEAFPKPLPTVGGQFTHIPLWHHNGTLGTGLRRRFYRLAVPGERDGLADVDGAGVKVHIWPFEGQQFSAPKSSQHQPQKIQPPLHRLLV